jgi:O-antigen/teichoic acid export membrane protein
MFFGSAGRRLPRSSSDADNRGRSSTSLFNNTVAQSAPLTLGYVFSFLSAPVILAGLGIRQFGIWALTGGIAQYIAALDGSGPSVSRFIAAHQDDRRACGEYVAIGLISAVVVSVLALAAAVAGAGLLSHALHGITTSDMRVVGVAASILILCGGLSNVICAYPVGHCRMVAPNIGLTVGATVNFIASVGAIVLGAGLAGYALANAGAALISLLVVTILVTKTEGRIPIGRPVWSRVTELMTYGVKYQLVWMSGLINFQTDKIVVGLSVGPSAAGAYELANRVAIAAKEVGAYPLTALLPTLTAGMSSDGIEGIRRRYGRLVEIASTFAFPPLLLAAAVAPILLAAWLSHVPPYATAVLVALLLAYIPNTSSGVSYVLGAAAGNPGIAARAAAATAAANVILTVILASAFGIWGVLGGTVVALTGGAVAQVLLIHRHFSLPLRAYTAAILPPLKVGSLIAIPVATISYSGLLTGRILQAFAVAALSASYLLIYGAWAIRSGRVPDKMRDWALAAAATHRRVRSRLIPGARPTAGDS